MKLLEYQAKNLLEKNGFKTPSKVETNKKGYVVKAQVQTTGRKEKGGIKFAKTKEEAKKLKKQLKNQQIGGEKVKKVLTEKQITIQKEYYISFTYSTETRTPLAVLSTEGGTGIENRKTLKKPIKTGETFEFLELTNQTKLSNDKKVKIARYMSKLFQTFLNEDMVMLELNPLTETKENELVIVDALIELDESAEYRHNRNFKQKSVFGREKTSREKRAKKIDEDDHRGIAGKYVELDGDIGMMLAGGGASLTNMDALIEYGGQPANYTEYGGNPPTEKVYKLSKVIMDKPNLKGLWHVGGTANNTDIYKTMKGFVKALKEEQPEYPIVIRRDGPQADKAFKLLRETREELNLNMKLYRNDMPMTKSAEKLMQMVKKQQE